MPRSKWISVDVCTTSCGASVGPLQKPWLVRRDSSRFKFTFSISTPMQTTEQTSGPTSKDRIPGANGKVACYYHLHGGCQKPWCSFWHAPTKIIRPTTAGVYKVFAQNMPGDVDIYSIQKIAEAIGELTTSKVKDLRTGKVFMRPKIKKFQSTMVDGRFAFVTHFKYAKDAEAFVDKLNKTPFGNNKICAELQDEHNVEILEPKPVCLQICQPVSMPEETASPKETADKPMTSTPTSVIPDPLKVDEDGFTPIRRHRKKQIQTPPTVMTLELDDKNDADDHDDEQENHIVVGKQSWADVVRLGANFAGVVDLNVTNAVDDEKTVVNAKQTQIESTTYTYMNECIVESKGDDCAYIYLPSNVDDDDYEIEEVFARHYLNARGLP